MHVNLSKGVFKVGSTASYILKQVALAYLECLKIASCKVEVI